MDERTRHMFRIIAYSSLLVIVIVTVYGVVVAALTPGAAIGNSFTEVYWPLPPYFAQPITYFSIASIALFYSGLRLGENRISKWPPFILHFLQLVGFVVAFSAAYEIIYNFAFWAAVAVYSGLHSGGPFPNPDYLSSSFPSAWSYVFATKAFSTLFVISGYSVYYLRRITKSGAL
jgi:hypothetical protein